MLIIDKGRSGRLAHAQIPQNDKTSVNLPDALLRKDQPKLPEVSELQVVRHYTQLSQKNFSIDTHFYPLGSCTMKYNPRGAHRYASLPEFLARHPLSTMRHSQGYLACLYELQARLKLVTGMAEVSLTPMAGAQGEFAGVAMIKAYHDSRQDYERTEILVPDAAHGTNPASAVMCGYTVKEISTKANGDIDIDALKQALSHKTAGIMLTNPSTLGVFEREIETVAKLVHAAGGLLYYDGANLNAILGRVRPGDMGFDVIHLNLHKTFATPHGGGGPGSGPVAVGARLVPFLPVPRVEKVGETYRWLTKEDCPQTIGQLSAFMGNAGILLRAFIYAAMLGREGVRRVSDFATLNANYLKVKLEKIGYQLAYPTRKATHEFIITLQPLTKKTGVTAMNVAKRLLDYGIHAPTTYFPLLVPECLLIEPTETESKESLDQFIAAMASIWEEIHTQPELVKSAPHSRPVRRLDDVRAVKALEVKWS
jgi:glycine dehydrogenase subunit 2